MMFKIAFRSVFRNFRRSLTTMLTIAVGAAAMLVFAAYALYDIYVLQTSTVQRGGHLTVFAKGYFDFGSGDPAIWGIADYAAVVRLIRNDPVLARLTAVVTPVQFLGGIAENPKTAAREPSSPPALCPPIRRAWSAGTNLASAKRWKAPRFAATMFRAV